MSRWSLLLLAACVLAACTVSYDFSLDLPEESASALSEQQPEIVAPPVRLPAYRQLELENGLRVLLMERHDVPLVGFEAVIRGGGLADPEEAAGTGALLARWLQKGAGERDARQFASAVEGVGGAFSVSGGRESLQLSGEFMSRDAELMIELLADTLLRPALDDAQFVKLRDRSIALLRAAKDSDPRVLIGTYGTAWLFQEHPYGRAVGGSEASLARIDADTARRYFRDHVGADRAILVVVGAFDSAVMEARIRSALGSWQQAAGSVPPVRDPTPVRGRRVLLVDKPGATQTYFWIGNVGVSRSFENRAALNLGNTVFGGRFTSMLNTELRIKSGLSYGASSRLTLLTERGAVAIVSFTKTDTTGRAVDLALDTLQQFRTNGLDEAALASAKAYLLGQFPLGFETSVQLAGQLAALRFYGLDDAYINDYPGQVVEASRQTVLQVARQVYPAMEDLAIVMIGDAQALGEVPGKFGEVTRVSLQDPEYLP